MKTQDNFTKIGNATLAKLNRRVAPSSFKVYVTLAKHTYGDKIDCHPGIDLIAKETKLTSRCVMKSLKELEDKGFIKVEKVKGVNGKGYAHNKYTLTVFEKTHIVGYKGKKNRVVRLIDNYRTPESIKTHTTDELYDLWRKLDSESYMYPDDVMTYTYIKNFIRAECESR